MTTFPKLSDSEKRAWAHYQEIEGAGFGAKDFWWELSEKQKEHYLRKK